MYAVRIDDERAAPLYEIGETIVCSPGQKPEVKDKVCNWNNKNYTFISLVFKKIKTKS